MNFIVSHHWSSGSFLCFCDLLLHFFVISLTGKSQPVFGFDRFEVIADQTTHWNLFRFLFCCPFEHLTFVTSKLWEWPSHVYSSWGLISDLSESLLDYISNIFYDSWSHFLRVNHLKISSLKSWLFDEKICDKVLTFYWKVWHYDWQLWVYLKWFIYYNCWECYLLCYVIVFFVQFLIKPHQLALP